MPGPIVQASPGGGSPRTEKILTKRLTSKFEVKGQDHQPQGHPEVGGGLWVQGAAKSDNERYKIFLAYMEEKREEARERLRAEEERKEVARRKESSWELMKEAITFLKTNEERWRERRIEECARIKEEEKRDRLALVKEKKKRYGLTKLSKEENMRLKMRTEERQVIAKVKANLWRRYREVGGEDMEEEEQQAWKTVEEGIEILEEKEATWGHFGALKS